MPILGVIASGISGNLTPSSGYISLASFQATDNTVSSFTFSSIPSTYKHLEIRTSWNEVVSNNNAFMILRLNSDATGANYVSQNQRAIRYTISGGGSQTTQANSTYSGNVTGIYCCSSSQDTPGSDFKGWVQSITRIYNYATTNGYKSGSTWAFHQASSQDYVMGRGWGSWKNTAAISSIECKFDVALVTGSTLSLYGIA